MKRDLYRRVRSVTRIVASLKYQPGTKYLILEPKSKARLLRLARKVAKQQVYKTPYITARECVTLAWTRMKEAA